jgi:hypothetical protein
MVKYCCFIWSQELIIKLLVFLPKFGSDEDWNCQLLIQHVNDKSPVTQEEMKYVFCWRQSPIVLFPLEEKENEKTPIWNYADLPKIMQYFTKSRKLVASVVTNSWRLSGLLSIHQGLFLRKTSAPEP